MLSGKCLLAGGTETTPLCRNRPELAKLTRHAPSPKTVTARHEESLASYTRKVRRKGVGFGEPLTVQPACQKGLPTRTNVYLFLEIWEI